jgi:hypothetical protein
MSATGRSAALLRLGGGASLAIALLHVAIAIAGPAAYRWFGVGMDLATQAERGAWWPPLVLLGVAVLFAVWALYAFSATGLGPRVPLARAGLVLITVVYLLRGVPLVRPLYGQSVFPTTDEPRYVVFTAVAFAIGLVHLAALVAGWRALGRA